MSEHGAYDLEQIRELRDRYRGDLLNNTLNFWLRFGVDREFGGINGVKCVILVMSDHYL